MSRFAGLKKEAVDRAAPVEAPADLAPERRPAVAKAREGKKPVIGYFSPDVRRALHLMSLDEGTTIQALLGESLDLLMRARGKHPFGER